MHRLIILFFCFAMTSCQEEEVFESIQVEFTEISLGSLNGSGFHNIDRSELVIDNLADWQALKDRMDTVNDVTSRFNEDNLDFTQELIIAVITEVKNIVYSVEIISVIEELNSMTVHYQETPSMLLSSSQPFHIIRIPRTTKLIQFNP